MTDWNNIELDRPSERDLNIIDSYSFAHLLLEIDCNLKDINRETVSKHFYEILENRINESKEIFEANLDNIIKYAKKYRKDLQ